MMLIQSELTSLDKCIDATSRAFSDALGESGETLPLGLEERLSLYRNLVAAIKELGNGHIWSSHRVLRQLRAQAEDLSENLDDGPRRSAALETLISLRQVLGMTRDELAYQLLLDPLEAAMYILRVIPADDPSCLRLLTGVSRRALREWATAGKFPRGFSGERTVLAAQLLVRLKASSMLELHDALTSQFPGLPAPVCEMLGNPRENGRALSAFARQRATAN